jgi:hypothetical protein
MISTSVNVPTFPPSHWVAGADPSNVHAFGARLRVEGPTDPTRPGVSAHAFAAARGGRTSVAPANDEGSHVTVAGLAGRLDFRQIAANARFSFVNERANGIRGKLRS